MVPLRKSHDHEAKCWLILGHPSNLQIPRSYDPISSPQPGLRLELLVELPFGRAGEDHAQLSRAERQVAEHRQVTSHHHTCAVEASETAVKASVPWTRLRKNRDCLMYRQRCVPGIQGCKRLLHESRTPGMASDQLWHLFITLELGTWASRYGTWGLILYNPLHGGWGLRVT